MSPRMRDPTDLNVIDRHEKHVQHNNHEHGYNTKSIEQGYNVHMYKLGLKRLHFL